MLPFHNKSTLSNNNNNTKNLTIVASQTPAGGNAGHSCGIVVVGPSKTHRGHVGAEAGGAGQLDEGDVVVDGVGVPLGVGEHLWGWGVVRGVSGGRMACSDI